MHLLQQVVSFQNYPPWLFFVFTAIEKSSHIHNGILRKTKEFASEQLDTYMCSHRGNPTSHGLFTEMEKKISKKNKKIKN